MDREPCTTSNPARPPGTMEAPHPAERSLALRLAALLSGAVLLLLPLAGCDIQVQKVDETVPSGSRPAPLPKIDRESLARAAATPMEGEAAAGEAAAGPAAPTASAASTEAHPAAAGAEQERRTGHIRLAGAFNVDAPAVVTCGTFSSPGFLIRLDAPGAPHVELRLSDFVGAGQYTAEVVVQAPGGASTVRESGGQVWADVDIRRVNQPRITTLVHGSFSGAFAGAAGEGTISGRFDPCAYDGQLP
ncbi:MAG TPA: hypothetical protein VHR45_19720 [Thermoanaerobaculia bacterium]|nr:hypothetical protein [Thermoanaerobaculia bacterium]